RRGRWPPPHTRLSRPRPQMLADEAMHLSDVGRRRREPAADCPDRLVGYDQILCRSAVGYRPLELAAPHREGVSALAFGAGLADADDGAESGPPRSQRLCADIGIGFFVVVAALGVPDDNGARTGVLEHFGRKVAGECSAGLGVTVLRANAYRGPFCGG